MPDHKELVKLLREHAVRELPEGESFTLRSGQKSRYYVDCRNLTLLPRGLNVLVSLLMPELLKLPFDAVGGPAVGADPIVGGLCFMAGLMPRPPFRGFLVRPGMKGHGLASRIIGPIMPGDRCVLVEDVATTGQSLVEAADALAAFGCKVDHAFCVVLRRDCLGQEAGAIERLADRGIRLTSLTTLEELFDRREVPTTTCGDTA